MASIFGDLMTNIDNEIAATFGSAAAGMSAYILPVGWAMFGISLLVWAILIMEGKIQSPFNDWMMKGLKMLLILQAASSLYATWVSGPLFQLPNDLATAVTGAASSTTALDALSDKLDQLIMGMAQAMVVAFKSLNIGGALVLLICIVAVSGAGSLLEIACVANMIYAKIGLALLLGVGPFFVMCLIWEPIKGFFFSWLNTVLYFTFLGVMSTMVMVIFMNIANRFMTKLAQAIEASTSAGSSLSSNLFALLQAGMSDDKGVSQAAAATSGAMLNILLIAIQLVVVFVPMFFVALEMRTLVSSMTSGSGGSFGSGVSNVASMALRAGIRPGNKK